MLFVSITSGHKASLYEEEITFVISLFGKILNKVHSKYLRGLCLLFRPPIQGPTLLTGMTPPQCCWMR